MMRVKGKGVSTALATIAIILVLILGMSWMAYMTVINAAQQARHAAAAETAALKAKELVRVYIWLDPARQSDGSYQNLTRISFVNTWSGETTINSLLIVWRDGRYEERPVSIRLGAGEDRTFLPSQLGLEGLDNYQAALERIKYIQVHTSLGNDFVSLWGRPDKPALYVTGTTRTDTYTVTRTSTTATATTTTRTTTTTSYTTTRTTTITWPPPPGTPRLQWRLLDNYCTCISVLFNFDPNGWGTPPYQIRGQWSAYNRWSFQLASGSFGPFTTSGAYSWTVGMSAHPDPASYSWTVTVTDSAGRVAEWRQGVGVNCNYSPPPGGGGGGGGGGTTTPPGPTTSSTTLPPAATTYTITETVTRTSFVFPYAIMTTTVTDTVFMTTTVWYTETVPVPTYITTNSICHTTIARRAPGGFDDTGCGVNINGQMIEEIDNKVYGFSHPYNSIVFLSIIALAYTPVKRWQKQLKTALLVILLTSYVFYQLGIVAVNAQNVVTTTTTITRWVTSTIGSYNTATITVTTTFTRTVYSDTYTLSTYTVYTCGPTTMNTEACAFCLGPNQCELCRQGEY
ncbi:MAG: hypothetical protein QW318_09115 [Candidatus Caldarchaeum sp.]